VNGAVKDIKVGTVGGVVQPGEDIIEIVPQDDQLLVEARIRPSDIAFLHPGQKAVVKITAYDFSIYGGLEGKVTDISADSITNEQGDTFYRVRVRTDKNYLERGGERLNIIPGMVASVDILTGEKTVMQYILKPLVKTLNNSLGER
jgi:adhesin transport system membrane fusion protein